MQILTQFVYPRSSHTLVFVVFLVFEDVVYRNKKFEVQQLMNEEGEYEYALSLELKYDRDISILMLSFFNFELTQCFLTIPLLKLFLCYNINRSRRRLTFISMEV